MVENLIVYILAFAGIWVGAGLAIKSVEKLSRSLNISSFIISFLVLGFFTSLGEMSVGVNSIIQNDPEIYIGNLIGASIVIFMLIIPLLAITNNGLKISQEFQGVNLLLSMIVIAAPVVLSIDGKVDRIDSLITLILYFLLIFTIHIKRTVFENIKHITASQSLRIIKEAMIIIIGIVVIFISSKFVVEKTLYFSDVLEISPFLISLLFISIGTNIPELSFVLRSYFMKSYQIAFGDYVGSAAFNSFLFGFLTILNGKPVYLTNSYFISLFFLISGLMIFYVMAKKQHDVTRMEGLLLLMIYVLFLWVELIVHL